MTRRPVLALLALLAVLAFPAGASGAIDYPDFSSTEGLQLNGDAKQEGNALRLTPALPNEGGAVYSTTPVNPQESFENQFSISMHDSTCCENPPGTGLRPADGMAFVIQNDGLEAGEGLGGSLGYSGIAPSVIVEFDIFYNAGEPLTDHVSIMKEGEGGNHLQCANAGPTPGCTANLPFPLYGAPVHGWVEYDAAAGRLKVWLSQDSTKPPAPLLDYEISLAALGGSAYVGFTAATGSHNAIQDVLSWRQGAIGSLNPPAAGPGPIVPKPKAKAKAKCPRKKGKGKAKGKGKGKGKGQPKAALSKKKGKAKGKGKGKGKKPKCPRKKGKGKAKGKGKGKGKVKGKG